MLYTIGHSTLKEKDFADLMGSVGTLIDVRSHPGSKAHPQFNKSNMETWMPSLGKKYEWWPGLGGWDVRHGADNNLRDEMNGVGVDLAVYSKGMFPKQRIAGYRLDMSLIKRQLHHGCLCGIDKGVLNSVRQTTKQTELSDKHITFLSQLHSRLIGDRNRALNKKLQLELPIDDKPEVITDPHSLSLSYKKLISSSSKLSKEISPCKWMAKPCETCKKPSLAPTWWSQGLYDYAYFMIQPEFKESVAELIKRSRTENVAICCCECLYYKCHRSLISDFCAFKGVDSAHIMGNNKLKSHSLVLGDRLQRYPEEVLNIWKSWEL